MTLDATIHAKKKIYKNLFVNAGASLGGGGGGSSVQQSKQLSGSGGFVKAYIGAGYQFDNNISLGVNYTNFQFIDSQIDSSQFNFFVEVPVSYSVGSYADAGKSLGKMLDISDAKENIFTLELNNIFQINPTGETKDTINSISLQYAHFLDENYYLYIGAEIGYKGRPLYNQFIHGVGYKSQLSSNVNLYTQLGMGSGGYSPNDIDTGSGLLVYPKFSLEYLLNNELGVSLSSGYLYAPTGTSKNYTAGLAINYHLSNKQKSNSSSYDIEDLVYKGFRFNIFSQSEFAVEIDNKKHNNINMMSIEFDNVLNDYWYFATQVSIAYNEFQGYPGYGEALFGVGLQTPYNKSDIFQHFFQLLIGANVHGLILKPSIGTNYSFNDKYALYLQFGNTLSLNASSLYQKERSMSAYNLGAGITYRFSLY